MKNKIKFLILLLLISCSEKEPPTPTPTPAPTEPPVMEEKTYFSFSMEENSGMAYSPVTKNLYIIQDSGNPPIVHVTDLAGKLLKNIKLPVKNEDWEDIAYYNGRIYVADFGDNEEERDEYLIHSFLESDPTDLKTIKFHYDKSRNAEGLAINPLNGDIYITTKNYDSKTHEVFLLKDSTPIKQFEYQSSPIGAMAFSTDGKQLIVIQDDKDQILFLGLKGEVIKVLSGFKEGAKESLEVISENELIYSAEGLEYFRKVDMRRTH